MMQNFKNFEEQFGGKVFIIFSINDTIVNIDIIEQIKMEIERLKEDN